MCKPARETGKALATVGWNGNHQCETNLITSKSSASSRLQGAKVISHSSTERRVRYSHEGRCRGVGPDMPNHHPGGSWPLLIAIAPAVAFSIEPLRSNRETPSPFLILLQHSVPRPLEWLPSTVSYFRFSYDSNASRRTPSGPLLATRCRPGNVCPRLGNFDQQTSGQHKVVRLGMMHQPPGSLLLDEGWAHEGGANSLLR